ncbi:hypothetical protein CLAFUW4_00013 [Fulvia fulva]|uniref:Uncharacterized protein n=1 Tax=Passalora fulva TaxID=5499 RepID=A0A9Q8P477_PASFU|nr:uncharacterized protein CLAFUR5_00012 [Fulvia fulva]KAK4634312.1 hypothetical protein CLAFUR4_00013 [Fulvia fulva]KAK4636891.1 hypothetical protein CLAFUR0_00013 [Fulvia fulva]UJO12795.1 hypothetical protein CLAFUR5_00012 [Fulvia fulva]WPV08440.1 hypothetical protein CLAFUW4_00013 [Fulvia fulva]WPV23916.1 hypothetical protein CLAFUW7_00013 [Fulvia fulva]
MAMLHELQTNSEELPPDDDDDSTSDGEDTNEDPTDLAANSDIDTVIHESPNPSDKKQEDLNRTYVIMRSFLRQAQAELEDRHEIFDRERAEFRKAQDAKNEPESITALDVDHIARTRELTQAVAEAEENFQQAKQAAFLAGVDLDESDLESGFVDRVDDGYRMSQEEDHEGVMDRDSVQRWLGRVEPQENPEQPTESVEIDD